MAKTASTKTKTTKKSSKAKENGKAKEATPTEIYNAARDIVAGAEATINALSRDTKMNTQQKQKLHRALHLLRQAAVVMK